MSQISTSDRILDAAEQLFAEHGIRATSLRAIVTRANVNLASVNYHFGSKEGLIRKVFSRRIVEVNTHRLSSLESLRESFAPDPIPVESIIRAFVEPALTFSQEMATNKTSFLQLMARAHVETDQTVQEELVNQLQGVIESFLSELRQSTPELSENDLRLRFSFMAGAMIHTILLPLNNSFSQLHSQVARPGMALSESIDALVKFSAAGFRVEAPSP